METLVMSPGMAELDKLGQVAEYLATFQADFPRRDQLRWAAVYVHGLLSRLPRKNIEMMARRIVLPPGWLALDAKQALQNFISHSPWDEDLLWRRHRARLAERLGREDGLFVIQEVPFVKHGPHSVGVQRQFSATLGRKINCQLAMEIHYVSAFGHAPLALRLYLPQKWRQASARLDVAGVPISFRGSSGKLQLALELLAEVRAEKFPGKYVAAPGLTIPEEISEALTKQGCYVVGSQTASGEQTESHALPLRKFLRQAQKDLQRMKDRLGLDHFEGRSWRGFHHHACLVALAFTWKT